MGIGEFTNRFLRAGPSLLRGIGYKEIKHKTPLTLTVGRNEHESLVIIEDHQLNNIQAYATFETKAFLGTIGQVKGVYQFEDASGNNKTLHLPHETIATLRDQLTFYADAGEVPKYLYHGGFVTFSIILEPGFKRKGLFEFKLSQTPFYSRYKGLARPKGKWLAVFSKEDIT